MGDGCIPDISVHELNAREDDLVSRIVHHGGDSWGFRN